MKTIGKSTICIINDRSYHTAGTHVSFELLDGFLQSVRKDNLVLHINITTSSDTVNETEQIVFPHENPAPKSVELLPNRLRGMKHA